MKKGYLLSIALCVILVGCSSGISQEEYESVSSAASAAESENESLDSEINSLKIEYAAYKESMTAYEESMSAYAESMSVYEGLDEAEANARKIEAESKADQESLAMESSKAVEESIAEEFRAAEEALRAAEEAKGYETGITFDQLARIPDDYIKQKVKFTGKVLQVMEGDGEVQIRLAVNSDYNTVIYCNYYSDIVPYRVLEDDVITIYGISGGLYSYESTMGGLITLPYVFVEKIEQ